MKEMNLFEDSENKAHLLTFQTPNVLDILLRDGEYLADVSKSREQRSYELDIKQLGGINPIWCFSAVGVTSRLNPPKVKDRFSQEDFINGSLFDRFRCEMSLPSGESLNTMLLLEIEIDKNVPKVGLTHNAYQGAVVIPKILKENLVAVYRLKYIDGDDLKYFYPDLEIIKLYKDNSIFKENFSCRKVKKV